MTNTSLKSQATKGVLWSVVEKTLAKGGRLITGIVLARILMPEDFGLIGMITVFIVISSTLINGGLGSGLIQKKRRTHEDFSTVFFYNVVLSVFIYIILFLTAPFIAGFYNEPQLINLTRILSINIVISSFGIVQNTIFITLIDFKTVAKVNILSIAAGGTFGIVLAFFGYGVWSLVAENLISTSVSVILLWFFSNWKPSFRFSMQSFRELFGFGYKLLVATILAQSINKIYYIVVGKVNSANELGFYTKAKSFTELVAESFTNIILQVSYPVLSIIQDDKERMIKAFNRILVMTAFFIFPIMTVIAILAEPLVRLVLTDKWIFAVPLIQWLCFAQIFNTLRVINMNSLIAKGRSDLYLKMDLIKLPIAVITLIVTIPFGLRAIVFGQFLTSVISYLFNARLSGKIFGYGLLAQFKDILPVFFSTALTAFSVFIINLYFNELIVRIILGFIAGLLIYLSTSYFFNIKELKEIQVLFQNLKKDEN